MDEHKQKATDYIVQQLRAGIPADTIVEHLRAANWPENYIAEAFQTAQQQFAPQQYQTAPAPQPVTRESVQPQQPQVQETTSQPLQPAAKPSAIPTKKGRIRTGWLLFKQTMTILKGHKQL